MPLFQNSRLSVLTAALAAGLLAACGSDAPSTAPGFVSPEILAAAEATHQQALRGVDEREQTFTARFELREDGTAVDGTTGLTWMRCTVGQVWQGGVCAGESTLMSWDQAQKAGAEMVFAGHADWRLPTRDELAGLIYCSSGLRRAPDPDGVPGSCEGGFRAPTLLVTVFPNAPAHKYWSATPDERYRFAAWGVSFYNGATGIGTHTDYVNVRLVRGTATPAPRQ